MIVRRGQIRRIGWVIKILEAQVGQFLLGCKCPMSRGIVVQEQDTLGDPPAALIRVQAFRDPLRGELPHVQILMNDGPKPRHVRCPVAQLLI